MVQLSFCFLGCWQVSLEGQALTSFESSKVRALLTYLVMEPDRPHYREALAGLFWPEMSTADAHANLRQALANLRKTISDNTAQPPALLISRTTIQFNRASKYTLDVNDFTSLLADCDRHPHRHLETCPACVGRLQKATELYHGDFLEGFFLGGSSALEEWELNLRENLRKLVLGALTHLAGFYERNASIEMAQRTLTRLVELDPLNEEAHQNLIRLLACSGQRNAALVQYNTCRRVLAEELGVEPSANTISLYEQIKSGELECNGPNAMPHLLNWSHPTKRLIGREIELNELAELIGKPDCRLLTILSQGGMGKSHLALESVAAQSWSFRDGACFVPLAGLASSEYLATAIADALGESLSSLTDPSEQLIHALREREILILLDSFEHLRQGTALLSEILTKAPGVHFVITSRERLDMEEEWLFELSGLRYPDGQSPESDFEKYSAIQFFLYSAKQVRSNFSVSAADYPSIAHICEMVDGMPLAIELAAAWVRVISCAEISVEIEHGLEILSSTRWDVTDRHRSLKVVFDNSWQLLTPEEQRALRSLSVFRGVFEREDAESVAGVGLILLSTLVNKSLVSWDHKMHYNMHELIGEYARQKLRESGDENTIYTRLTETILHYSESAELELRGPQQGTWLDRLESQRNNMRSAFEWILLHGSDQTLEKGLRIVSAMAGFWWLRGMSEGRNWLASLLNHPRAANHTMARARALTLAGDLAIEQQGNFGLARTLYEESMLISMELGDKQGVASTLLGQGVIAYASGDVAGAQSLTEQSLEIWQTLEESWGVAWATHRLGDLAFERGDMESARRLFNECLVIRREIGDKSGIGWLFQRLGEIARYEGFYEQAQAMYEEALRLHRELASNGGVTATITSMGYLALNQGNPHQARSLFKEGLSQNLGNQILNALCLIGLAGAVIDPAKAVRWLGAADSTFAQSSSFIDRIDHERILTAAHSQLDESTFEVAWEAGRSMLLEQAIEFALQDEHNRESC